MKNLVSSENLKGDVNQNLGEPKIVWNFYDSMTDIAK